MIPCRAIRVDTPNNGRSEVDPAAVQTLADLIARHGLINPITVRVVNGAYRLVAGNTRLLAHDKLGRDLIACVIKDLDDQEAAMVRLTENTGRTQLTPVDEAMQLAAALEARGGGTDALATAVGHSQAWLEARLDILSYDPSLIAHIHAGKISLAAARQLARIPDAQQREALTHQAAEHGITASTASQWLQQCRTPEGPVDAYSENERETGISEFKTTTTAKCIRCETHKPLEETATTRICHACIDQLSQTPPEPRMAQPQQPQAPIAPGAQTG